LISSRLRNIKIAVLACGFLLLSHPAALWGQSAEQKALDAIQSKYEQTRTFQAEFVQKSYVKMMNQTLEAKGQVQIKKPGQMKWVYEAPDPQVLVSNNKTLWLYVPEDEQVTKMPVENIYSSNTPALFLAGKGKLTDSFLVTQVERGERETTVVLVPKEEDDTLDRLLLHADNKSFQIVGSSVYDKLGNRTEMRFKNILIDRDIPGDTFQFQVPDNVELLDYTTTP
jgi:outer membrane lipoprotein carrier protein